MKQNDRRFVPRESVRGEATKAKHIEQQQRDVIAQARAESCVDPRVKLGFPTIGRPESGMSCAAYYGKKHAPGGPGPGRFHPLHVINKFGNRAA